MASTKTSYTRIHFGTCLQKTLSTATQIFHCLLILWDTKALRQRESICGAPPMSNAPQLIRLLIGNERLKHDEVVDNSVLFG